MGRFLTELNVKRLPDKNGRKQWQLLSPFIYESANVGIIIVPTGFVTDFASIPRLPFVYWIFGGAGDEEAVLHDFLYQNPHTTGCGVTVDRSLADKVLRGARYSCERINLDEYESVTLTSVLNKVWAYLGAWCFWAGVRVDGSSHWDD